MILGVIKTSFISLGAGFLAQFIQSWVGSCYLDTFLKNNLINLLVALLAINSATMGIVLTKIRELADKHNTSAGVFNSTKREMLISIKEQITLIIVGLVLLTIVESQYIDASGEIRKFLQA